MKSENHIVKLSPHIDVLLLKGKKHFVKEQENKNTLKEDRVWDKFDGEYQAKKRLPRKREPAVCVYRVLALNSLSNTTPPVYSQCNAQTLLSTSSQTLF